MAEEVEQAERAEQTERAEQWLIATRECLAQARLERQTIRIEGHGSKAFYGNPVSADRVLSTLGYAGVVDYDPTELVVVVRAGTPILALESLLESRGQRLAFEPPRFGSGGGTVGGMIASGLSGPARWMSGACRDFVLGMTVMNSQGDLLRYGGTVMKNVAGYDLARLHTGALGSLGIVLDVALKVLPLPAARLSLEWSCPEDAAREALNEWAARPLPLSASAWIPNQLGGLDGTLRLRLSGARAAVDEAANAFCQSPQGRLGLARPLKNAAADAFWLSIRDQTHTAFHSSLPLWRVSLPARSEGHADFSPMLVEWGGGLRWIATNHSAQAVRAFAADRSGHAALYRPGQGQALPSDGVFMPLEPVIDRLHQRIREELDPMGLLNPGRLSPAMARAA